MYPCQVLRQISDGTRDTALHHILGGQLHSGDPEGHLLLREGRHVSAVNGQPQHPQHAAGVDGWQGGLQSTAYVQETNNGHPAHNVCDVSEDDIHSKYQAPIMSRSHPRGAPEVGTEQPPTQIVVLDADLLGNQVRHQHALEQVNEVLGR